MEECQAVVTRVPLPLPLLWRCCCRHCYGIAPHSVAAATVAAMSLPSLRHAGAARSNSNINATALPAPHPCLAHSTFLPHPFMSLPSCHCPYPPTPLLLS